MPKGGRLLDVELLRRTVHRVSAQFSLRGVEATVMGRLFMLHGRPAVRLSGTGEVLRLGPLHRKVQWDAQDRKDQPPTREELLAYQRLLSRWNERSGDIRLVGPVGAAKNGKMPLLEVREFSSGG